MKVFAGRTAVVTGAASGMGLAMARRFAQEKMNVVMADVETGALEKAARVLEDTGAQVLPVRTDVSRYEDVEALAARATERFGNVHILCLNAGVVRPGAPWQQSLDDWKWVLGVNLWGVVYGIRAFVPRMLAHGEESHVEITSSAGGLVASGMSASYTVSKFGVVGLAEALADGLAQTPGAKIGVSVLCPGGVKTGIFRSDRNRPAELSERGEVNPASLERFNAMGAEDRTDQVSPEYIGDLVFEAIKNDQFYILPMQPHFKEGIGNRLHRLEEALASSPVTGV